LALIAAAGVELGLELRVSACGGGGFGTGWWHRRLGLLIYRGLALGKEKNPSMMDGRDLPVRGVRSGSGLRFANGQNRPSLWAFGQNMRPTLMRRMYSFFHSSLPKRDKAFAFCNLLAWFFRTVLNMNLVKKKVRGGLIISNGASNSFLLSVLSILNHGHIQKKSLPNNDQL
jgi:hypothetical protein